MRLARAVVGILTEDDHLDPIKGRGIQGGKYPCSGRVNDLARRLLCAQELAKRLHAGILEHVPQARFPGGLEPDRV